MQKDQIIVVLVMIFAVLSCGKSNENKTDSSTEVADETENFKIFYEKFYSDNDFQISRLIFPIENDIKIEAEIAEAQKDSFFEGYFEPHTRDNWNILRNIFNSNDSLAQFENVIYKRKIYHRGDYIEEIIMFANDEFPIAIMKFKLIDGKWFLFDYVND